VAKDFDVERLKIAEGRDLEFVAGGEVFHITPFVPPEHLDAFQPMNRPEGKDVIEVYDEWILSMLVEEDRKRWTEMRKKAKPPLELHSIETIVFWLVEQATGRPTVRPSSSRPGQTAPTVGSGATSSSKVTPV
jgi:hypothetical protein